jgi:hypothetical protein
MMAVHSVDPDDRARAQSWKRWWFAWRKRIRLGAIGRIQGALSNLKYKLARSTIAAILERHGIEPAPERNRRTTWKEFLARHWELIVAADFFTVEVWTRRGLQRFLVLFFY